MVNQKVITEEKIVEELNLTLKKACQSDFYRGRFKENKINQQLKRIDDFQRIPFTKREEIEQNNNHFLAVPFNSVVRVSQTSGTSGKHISIYYTQDDLKEYLIPKQVEQFQTTGVKKKDVVLNSLGYGLITAGFEWESALLNMGATVLPVGTGNMTGTKRQIELLQKFNATVLNCTPSYALKIIETAMEINYDLNKSNLRMIQLTGERLTEKLRKSIGDNLQAEVFNLYGCSEFGGIAAECSYHEGLHIQSNKYLFPEVIDPDTYEAADEGILVLTSLRKEAMPLIRYWTNDYVVWTHEKCKCGSDQPRILEHKFRADQMVKYKGVLINPVDIEDIIESIPELGERYTIVIYREGQLEKVKIEVEARTQKAEELKNRVEEEIHTRLGLRIDVNLLSPGILSNDWKLKHIRDLRESS